MMKPVVASENEQRAIENINAKLALLNRLLSHMSQSDEFYEVGEKGAYLNDMNYPKTIRQFNLWTTAALPSKCRESVPFFGKNANATLNRHGSIKESVRLAIGALKKATNVATPSQRREDNVASLRRRIKASEVMREIAERALVDARNNISALNEKLSSAEKRAVNDRREAADAISKLEHLLKQLRSVDTTIPSKSSTVVLLKSIKKDV